MSLRLVTPPASHPVTIEEARKRYHDGDEIYYGQVVNGALLGVGTPDPARPAGAPDWVETVRVHFPRYNRHADELCVSHPADVIWAVEYVL